MDLKTVWSGAPTNVDILRGLFRSSRSVQKGKAGSNQKANGRVKVMNQMRAILSSSTGMATARQTMLVSWRNERTGQYTSLKETPAMPASKTDMLSEAAVFMSMEFHSIRFSRQ